MYNGISCVYDTSVVIELSSAIPYPYAIMKANLSVRRRYIMQQNMSLKRVFLMVFMLVVAFIPSVFAMEITSSKEIMSPQGRISMNNKSNVNVRDEDGVKLRFTLVQDDNKMYLKLMSKDKKSDYFSFPIIMHSHVYEIQTNSPKKTFWLIQSNLGESSESCQGFWLVGKYDGKYVNYVTLDSLTGAGLGIYNLFPKFESDGRIVVSQWKRNYGEDIRNAGGKMYSYVDSATLFWDDGAQWFGIKH